MQKFQLVLLIHAHQPVGNFDDVFERAYQKSYLPFVETLTRHPSIKLGLHFTGSLLEWIERAHPEYFQMLGTLVLRGQVEMIGGGYYEPVLICIPPDDRREQIARLAGYVESKFQVRPRGAWVAERVWEPQLPSTLAPAGVEYALVDDNHFLGAGFTVDQLHGYYLAEDMGSVVKMLPGLKSLRYLIPFQEPGEIIAFLRNTAEAHPGGFASMGDDLEKFGVWPGTHEHCYKNGWLERFFQALESSFEWVETATPSAAIDSHAALGRADLPAASYTEMMEWSLPNAARTRYHALTAEFSSRPGDIGFLRGGTWRNFFTKYCESNLLQKKMLHVSAKLEKLGRSRRVDAPFLKARAIATTLLLRGQCNDAYWHGVFGGLYTPHLRTALWQSLSEAESIADSLARRSRQYAHVEKVDFDADNREEVYFTSDRYAALWKPSDGATLCALDCRTAKTNLINSLTRREEAYHARVKNLQQKNDAAVMSIHDQTRTKEEGLERWLRYDRWPRHSFRLLLFDRERNFEDYAASRLQEDATLAAGEYYVAQLSNAKVSFSSSTSLDWQAEKHISLRRMPGGFEIVCDLRLRRMAPGDASVNMGIETIVNFLAPDAPDRYFESAGEHFPLRWSSSAPAPALRVVDEWEKVAITIDAPGTREFWVAPIETVSESEDGFERIYQGSQILAVWPVEIASGAEWTGQFVMRVSRAG